MLLLLTNYLAEFISGFSVFQYLTFRIMVSVLTALAMSLLIGPFMIRRLGDTARSVKRCAKTARRPIWPKPARRPWAVP